MDKAFIRQQFNRQAKQFANFGLTRNEDIFKFIFDFCEFVPDDTLLDVACGSGAFVNFCARSLKAAFGVDLSDELLKHAKDCSGQFSPCPEFLCCDVENLSFSESSFTLVTCRSAFHHMENPDIVIGEMVRILRNGGKICIQDMTSFSEPCVNDFFEKMEKLVDPSHHRVLSANEIKRLLSEQNVNILNAFETTITFNLYEYFGHALQSEKSLGVLLELIYSGLSDREISEFLFEKENDIYFKRSGLMVYGKV